MMKKPKNFWLSKTSKTCSGRVKQGCVLSPTLFNYCIDWVLKNALSSYQEAQIGQNLSLTDLDYADDVGLLSDPVEAQDLLDSVVAWAALID